jgi:TctA family transporter
MTRHGDAGKPLNARMLSSFVGGLCARSVLEIAKNAFDVVFRA